MSAPVKVFMCNELLVFKPLDGFAGPNSVRRSVPWHFVFCQRQLLAPDRSWSAPRLHPCSGLHPRSPGDIKGHRILDDVCDALELWVRDVLRDGNDNDHFPNQLSVH